MRLKTVSAAIAVLFLTLTGSASAARVRSDLNGDGKSDVVVQDAKTGAVAVWLAGNAAKGATVIATPSAGSQIVATGDLDNDGKSDIILQNSGAVILWTMNGATRVSEATIANPKAGWRVVGARDVTGDGKDDLFLQHENGRLAIWEMSGATINVGRQFGASTDCAVALGNFNGNAVLLYSPKSERLQRKRVSDENVTGLREGGKFNAVAVGDFDGDGDDDIVEQAMTGGAVNVLLFDEKGTPARSEVTVATPEAGWKVAGTGDYDGDGRADLLLFSATGGIAQWLMNGTTVGKRTTLATGSDWKPILAATDCVVKPEEHVHPVAAKPVPKPAPTYAGKGSKIALTSTAPGEASGYLSLPKGAGKKPAIIVIQEWWGLNNWIIEQTDRFASQGYVAIAVDLYRGRVATSPEEAHELSRGLPEDRAIADLKAGFNYLASRKDVDAKRIGVIGWCMGGGYSLGLAVAEPRLAACIINYGRLVTDPALIAKIQAPVLGNFGAADRGIPPADVNAFDAAMKKAGKSSDVKIYEGAGHGFMNPNNTAGYVYESTQDAWKRIDAFFAKRLRRPS